MHRILSEMRVLVADPHPLTRIGLRCLLENTGGIRLVAETGSGLMVASLVEETKPDVLILEMELPGLSGVAIAEQLQASNASVRVLGFSIHDDARYVFALLRSGAAGYLTKDEAPEAIVAAVHSIASGGSGWLSRRAAAKLTNALTNQRTLSQLTERQQQVLCLVAAGQTNREIGCKLGISAKTVEKHYGGLMSKLSVASRVEMAVQVIQNGWLPNAFYSL